MNYLVLTLLLCMQYFSKSYGFYYWKDYHNKVPADAYKAGVDGHKENVYIGQALIKAEEDQGIYPTSIVEGKDVYAAEFGAKKANNFVQILCSTDPENFEWIPANSTHLHLLETSNDLVRGGVEDDELVNIGRLKFQGGIVIGKVLSAHIGNANMWFIYDGNERKAVTYEVLTYNDIRSKIQTRIDTS